jgi:hypothetical protein
MRRYVIATAAAAVVMMAAALLATAAAPATAAAGANNCLLCHPQAHPSDWMTEHATDLAASDVSESTCADCHEASYCDSCHAQVPGLSSMTGASGWPAVMRGN